MKNKVIKILAISVLVVAGLFSAYAAPHAYAADDKDKPGNGLNCSDVPEGVQAAAGCNSGNSEDAFQNTIVNILTAVIGMAGLVAVVFIVVGGVQYMTSSGDPNKTKKAKDTILYAVIGLIICALAFGIVNWAAGVINNSESSSESSNKK